MRFLPVVGGLAYPALAPGSVSFQHVRHLPGGGGSSPLPLGTLQRSLRHEPPVHRLRSHHLHAKRGEVPFLREPAPAGRIRHPALRGVRRSSSTAWEPVPTLQLPQAQTRPYPGANSTLF